MLDGQQVLELAELWMLENPLNRLRERLANLQIDRPDGRHPHEAIVRRGVEIHPRMDDLGRDLRPGREQHHRVEFLPRRILLETNSRLFKVFVVLSVLRNDDLRLQARIQPTIPVGITVRVAALEEVVPLSSVTSTVI